MSIYTDPKKLQTVFFDYEREKRILFRDTIFKGCLGKMSEAEIIHIFAERRYISNRFSLFCDTIYPLLKRESDRDIVKKIILDEYHPENHRELFVSELSTLGFNREKLKRREFSTETKAAAFLLTEYADFCSSESDLYMLVSLRFFGEILAGEEFMFFLRTLFKDSQSRNTTDSVFLKPHIDYDVVGHSISQDTHADVYIKPIESLLKSNDELLLAKRAVDKAYTVRASFYKQFCDG